jgi:hypothetical protein
MWTRKSFLVAAVLFVMLCVTVGSIHGAPAQPTTTHILSPEADVYVRDDQPTTTSNTNRLALKASVPDGSTCSPQMISYLKFDLGDVLAGETVSVANLVLSVENADLTGSITMAIKASDTTDWLESGTAGDPKLPTWNNPLALGATVYATAQSAASGTITFTSSELASYLNGKKGGLVTLAIVPQLPCTGFNPFQNFRSKEYSSGVATPTLTINPSTAISLSTFRAADPATNWPLIVGLGALAAVVIGGLAVARRRAARG